jgi:hypothetical protein
LIRREVFELAGEELRETAATDDDGEEIEPCPGEQACSYFAIATRETGNGLDACQGCESLPTKPTAETVAVEDEADAESLVDEIRDIRFWEAGGQKTDWTCYPFEYYQLFSVWKDAERQVENIRQARMQAFLKGWMEKGAKA